MKSDTAIVVGDIGGTNTSIALMEPRGSCAADGFRIMHSLRFATQELSGPEQAIGTALEAFSGIQHRSRIGRICLSAAGPVHNNSCTMTNAPWKISGADIEEKFSIPCLLINDFSAVCLGIPLLEAGTDYIQLDHPDGQPAQPTGDIIAAIGAGTGLGSGFLIRTHNAYRAFPSEGGHADLAPVDQETFDLYHFLQQETGSRPSAEMAVSGTGIYNIYRFLRLQGSPESTRAHCADTDKDTSDLPEKIDTAKPKDAPALISTAAARGLEPAAQCLRQFVRLYANFASNTAVQLLPRGGIYLAGGIAAKNIPFFTGEQLFMRTFLQNDSPGIRRILAGIPVYIICNYDVSLLGAAYAAMSQEETQE